MNIQDLKFAMHEYRIAKKKDDNFSKGKMLNEWKIIREQDYVAKLSKMIKLPSFIRKKGDDYEIDVLNCSYDQLNNIYQMKYISMAQSVLDIYKHLENDKKLTEREKCEKLHNDWLKNNLWAKDGENDVEYCYLPQRRKDYYEYIIRTADIMQDALKLELDQNYTLIDVINLFNKHASMGLNEYIAFKGQNLYTRIDDESTIYKKVVGMTKTEYEKEIAIKLHNLKQALKEEIIEVNNLKDKTQTIYSKRFAVHTLYEKLDKEDYSSIFNFIINHPKEYFGLVPEIESFVKVVNKSVYLEEQTLINLRTEIAEAQAMNRSNNKREK